MAETIDLYFPVDVDGVRYARLTMRRATPHDLQRRARNCTAAERGMLFAALLCEIDFKVFLALDQVDLDRVGQALNRQIDGLLADIVLSPSA
ncbi:phage tail assembly protein [Aureimonas psammosilenae]|uniref:phage tail assembly protein n=1 Tax=Aureimonas psammosilenae TaxID=2495496 RepID=UPI00186A80F2|nr:phage tail assembly protein [Aureimonas psammosilenae]